MRSNPIWEISSECVQPHEAVQIARVGGAGIIPSTYLINLKQTVLNMELGEIDPSSRLLEETPVTQDLVGVQEQTDAGVVTRAVCDTPDDVERGSENISGGALSVISQRENYSGGSSSRPTQERTDEDKEATSRTSTPSVARKFSKMAIVMLILGTILILATLGFLAFLWFAGPKSRLWHEVITRDWLVKAVTISTEIIKQAVTFQLGVVSAMLAALALERFQVPLPQVASISMMRAGTGSGQLLSLSKHRFHRQCFKTTQIGITTLILTATTIFALIQAISIVLISDIGLEPIPGKANSTEMNIGFTYNTPNYTNVPQSEVLLRGTTWLRKPPYYPTFAEYSEPPFVADGVDDTGLTLRGFLPFLATQDRQNVRSYHGMTTVLDARVTCQVPILSNETLQMDSDHTMTFTGSVQASRKTPRLQNSVAGYTSTPSGNLFQNEYNKTVPFQCLAPVEGVGGSGTENTSLFNPWKMTICQLNALSGGLAAEFVPDLLIEPNDPGFEDSGNYGTSYLILNITLGSEETWAAITRGAPAAPPEYGESGEWLDLVYSKGSLVLGVTLCFSAFRTADIPVTISSPSNRTEPTTSFDFSKSIYEFSAIRKQLGQGPNTPHVEKRGVLQLEKSPSWLADPSELPPPLTEPFVRDFANMRGPLNDGNTANYTAFLWQAPAPLNQTPPSLLPDPMHMWLFQEIVTTGGSIAFALQSLITVLSGMAYYDQIAQFDHNQTAEVVYFVTANVPQTYWGFSAVCAVLLVHMSVVAVVVVIFAQESRFSMLGNTWQGLSQVVNQETREYIEAASMMTDSEVKEMMSANGLEKAEAGIDEIDGPGVVGVMIKTDAQDIQPQLRLTRRFELWRRKQRKASS